MGEKILIIDDDPALLELAGKYLEKVGFETHLLQDSSLALDKMETLKPHVVFIDLMMPKVDGFHLIKEIRERKEFSETKIIVISAKSFEFDKDRAYEMGAQYFIKKPLEYKKLHEIVNRVIKDELKVTFWGTRGTLAKPGPDTLKYGGNTSCVSLEFTKDRLFIFDAGTGVTELGKYLISHNRRQKMNLFITHPHWDHINGFPFFMPVYQHGNEMVVYGSSHGNISLREVIGGQMESIYFPVTIKEFASRVYFKEIMEGEYDVEGISLKAIMLNHPGITLGYRATNSSGKSVAYITDNEIIPDDIEKNKNYLRNKLVAFLKGVDILIHDSSYFDDEYRKRVGWGHPAISEVLRLAEAAEVKNLYLSHHDPDHDDAKVAEKEAFGRRYFEKRKLDIGCFSAIEGNSVVL